MTITIIVTSSPCSARDVAYCYRWRMQRELPVFSLYVSHSDVLCNNSSTDQDAA